MKVKTLLIFAALILVCVVGWTGQAQRNKPAATTWEYQVILDPAFQSFASTGEFAKGIKEMNEIGAQGWEIVGVTNTENGVMLYLKRAK